MSVIEVPRTAGYFGEGCRFYRADYSFAVKGGAVSTIPLIGSTLIPSGTVILGGFIEVTTQLTSGGSATIAVGLNTTSDILAPLAVASWTVGMKQILPAYTGSTMVKTTAARDLTATIATAALTAGVFKVVLFAVEPMTP